MNKNNVSWILLSFSVLFHIAAWALQPGSFTQQSIQAVPDAQLGSLAVIDTSQTSLEWLRLNREYLEQAQIPVIVLNADMRSMLPLWQEFALISSDRPVDKDLSSLEQLESDFRAPLSGMEQPLPQGGLIIGPEPANPPGLIAAFLEQMGIVYYPVVIERGIAWQVNPFIPAESPEAEGQKQ